MYHLRDGFYFAREDSGYITIQVQAPEGKVSVTVPQSEFASAMAAVSRRGETGETFHEAEEFLSK